MNNKEFVVFEERCDEGVRTFAGGVCGTIRTTEAGGDKRVLIIERFEHEHNHHRPHG